MEQGGWQPQPAPTLVPLSPFMGAWGPGPAYRSLMTFGQADDLVCELHSHRTPGHPTSSATRLLRHRCYAAGLSFI
jgi:hypothetical protein